MKRLPWIGGIAALLVASAAAAWLIWGPDADQEAERLALLLQVDEGSTVAEIGAGGGEMTLRMAEIAGPGGRVYSTEIESAKRDEIRLAAEGEALRNVTVLEARENSTNLADECCDAIFMRQVYHHIKRPTEYNRSLLESLKPGGRLAVIDFAPGGILFFLPDVEGVPANRGGHGIPPDVLIAELTEAGFGLEQRNDDWSSVWFCVVVRKPEGQ